MRTGNRPAVNVPPFDPSDISPVYNGLAQEMKELILARVRTDFKYYDVEIYSTEGEMPQPPYSTIYFGTYDPALLGVADGVDEYNGVLDGNAIVFTDSFDVFMPLNPSVAQMSQAIANVASHETGHLLGLVHTSDANDLIDVTASLRQLLDDQDFKTAPLYSQVFPIGGENSPLLLDLGVGLKNVPITSLAGHPPSVIYNTGIIACNSIGLACDKIQANCVNFGPELDNWMPSTYLCTRDFLVWNTHECAYRAVCDNNINDVDNSQNPPITTDLSILVKGNIDIGKPKNRDFKTDV